MVVYNRRGSLQLSDIKDLLAVGIPIHYQLFDCTALDMVTRISGMSKAVVRRRIKDGAVWFGGCKITDSHELIDVGNVAATLFIGKELLAVILPVKTSH